MSKTESQQEPEAPAIELWRGRPAPAKPDLIGTQPPLGVRQGMPSLPDHNGFEQSESDRQEWLKDLEERRARALRLQQQRLEPVAVDVVSELDSALSALEHRATGARGLPQERSERTGAKAVENIVIIAVGSLIKIPLKPRSGLADIATMQGEGLW